MCFFIIRVLKVPYTCSYPPAHAVINSLRPSTPFHFYLYNFYRQFDPGNQSHQSWDGLQLHSLRPAGSENENSFGHLHSAALCISLRFVVVVGIFPLHRVSAEVCMGKLGSLLFCCIYRDPPRRRRLQPKAMWVNVTEGVYLAAVYVCVIMCACSSFLSTYSFRVIGVAWRVPAP